jgi:hypothetical protein
MKSPRSQNLQMAITAVIAVIVAFWPSLFIDRHAYLVAVFNYAMNPTVQNDAIMKVQAGINGRAAFETRFVAFASVFALLNVVWLLFRRTIQSPSDRAGE